MNKGTVVVVEKGLEKTWRRIAGSECGEGHCLGEKEAGEQSGGAWPLSRLAAGDPSIALRGQLPDLFLHSRAVPSVR